MLMFFSTITNLQREMRDTLPMFIVVLLNMVFEITLVVFFYKIQKMCQCMCYITTLRFSHTTYRMKHKYSDECLDVEHSSTRPEANEEGY